MSAFLCLDTVTAPTAVVIFCSCQLILLGDREGLTLPLLIVVRLFMVAALPSDSLVSYSESFVFPIQGNSLDNKEYGF